MPERIMVADDDPVLRAMLQAVLEDQGFEVHTVPDGDALVRAAHESVPDLLLIDVMMPGMDGLEAIRQLRHDTRTAHLPMLLLTALDHAQQEVAGFDTGADDYISKPFVNDVLIARIKANLRRRSRTSVNHPLTGLPGNLLIAAEVNHRLEHADPFTLLYIDLDNFKSFNDAYGFARGDQIILLLADLLRAAQADEAGEHDFVGHIGGDDFIALVDAVRAETWANTLIRAFDAEVPKLYDETDRERGFLVGLDRFGAPHRFPLVSVSIGGVDTSRRLFHSYNEVAAVAAEVKGYAKKLPGSQYVLDERQQPYPGEGTLQERRGQPPLIALAVPTSTLQAQWLAWCAANSCRSMIFQALPTMDQLSAMAPNLVLLDLTMPDAWAWLNHTRNVYPALPIIALADQATEQSRALEAGTTACFIMPAAPELVATALIHLLRLNAAHLRYRAPNSPRK